MSALIRNGNTWLTYIIRHKVKNRSAHFEYTALECSAGFGLSIWIACLAHLRDTITLFQHFIIGAGMFIMAVWIRAEPGFEEWVQILNVYVYYIGIYILIAAAVIVMIVSFLGCCSALMENTTALYLFVATQGVAFLVHVAGSAVLLDYSTLNSSIQPIIRDSMKRLIMSSSLPESTAVLKMIQENIGCCGADGSNDYIIMRQPLPSTCRDTVTGNAFFHGCVDELTWLLEDKSGWVAGLAMTLALIQVVNVVLSLVLVQALKKEEDEARNYRQ